MKTNNSVYGVVALLCLAAASVLSHAGIVMNNAALNFSAALMGCGFLGAVSNMIAEVAQRTSATVEKIDFSRNSMNKAA